MKLRPKDIGFYLYCPYLLQKGDKAKNHVLPVLSFFEKVVIEAIKDTERDCLLKGREVAPRKFLKSWDNLWWPLVAKNNINIKKAEELSLKAANKFTEYCKYDFTGYMYPTVAVNAVAQKQINRNILHGHIDVLKVNLTQKKKNIVMVDFSRKDMGIAQMVSDPIIRSNAWSFYKDKEQIHYICVDVCGETDKLKVSQAVFRPADIDSVEQMINHIGNGIQRNILYYNRWNCEECKACDFNFLMKNDSL